MFQAERVALGGEDATFDAPWAGSLTIAMGGGACDTRCYKPLTHHEEHSHENNHDSGACQNAYRRTGASYCESCFARFLMSGCDPDLACVTAIEDDQTAQKTLIMQAGVYQEMVLLTAEERERLASEWQGWAAWLERVPVEPVPA